MVIEEYLNEGLGLADRFSTSNDPYIIVLSAKTEDRLKEMAENLHAYLTENHELRTVNLRDLAYTLQRRQAMEERVVFMVRSFSELKEKLRRLSQGVKQIKGSYRGNTRKGKEWTQFFALNKDMNQVFETWIRDGKIMKAAELWVKGVEVNWTLFYERQPGRIRLPTYPLRGRGIGLKAKRRMLIARKRYPALKRSTKQSPRGNPWPRFFSPVPWFRPHPLWARLPLRENKR